MKKEFLQAHNYLVLTPTEERLLRFLTSQKQGASITQTAKAIGLARTSIYNAARSLVARKFVVKDGFAYVLTSAKWKPYVENAKDPKEQIKAFMHEMLLLKRGEILYSIESDEEIQELVRSKKEFLNWQKAATEKGVVLKGIGTKNALSFFQSMLDDNLTQVIKRRSGSPRLTGGTIQGPCVFVSFRNSIVFFSRRKNFFYRIDDAHVARFSQSIIDLLYNALEYQPIVAD